MRKSGLLLFLALLLASVACRSGLLQSLAGHKYQTSWGRYLDNMIDRSVGTISKGAIIKVDDCSIIDQSDGLNLSAEEAKRICEGFKEESVSTIGRKSVATIFQKEGFKINGLKYYFIRYDGNGSTRSFVVAARTDHGTVVMGKSQTMLFLGTIPDKSYSGKGVSSLISVTSNLDSNGF